MTATNAVVPGQASARQHVAFAGRERDPGPINPGGHYREGRLA